MLGRWCRAQVTRRRARGVRATYLFSHSTRTPGLTYSTVSYLEKRKERRPATPPKLSPYWQLGNGPVYPQGSTLSVMTYPTCYTKHDACQRGLGNSHQDVTNLDMELISSDFLRAILHNYVNLALLDDLGGLDTFVPPRSLQFDFKSRMCL
ncbi:hypothetical protein FPOAC1_012030 [Fusarium poae]|uniref:hypothetical protein n=1 Tax=Fusarium poae TaxID=36050 RepID=UPI001CEB0CBE|nr:hypothetical protein FPOAC1_012030 [Fusarium poae]KAG8667205.1 hypothetical protein FPOAC1_012030 [Fusarium poae]